MAMKVTSYYHRTNPDEAGLLARELHRDLGALLRRGRGALRDRGRGGAGQADAGAAQVGRTERRPRDRDRAQADLRPDRAGRRVPGPGDRARRPASRRFSTCRSRTPSSSTATTTTTRSANELRLDRGASPGWPDPVAGLPRRLLAARPPRPVRRSRPDPAGAPPSLRRGHQARPGEPGHRRSAGCPSSGAPWRRVGRETE